MSPADVPVLLVIFNRPDTTKRVIEALAHVRPTRVYIAADGPRATVPSDVASCAETRAVALSIDWPCTVQTHFSEHNRGVDPGVEEGIRWFFSHEDSGIILEDDCVPHPDFFSFVSVMLERYRTDVPVGMISGDNFQNGQVRGDGSYYFSHYPNTWGWATWKRAWDFYDTKLTTVSDGTAFKSVLAHRPHRDEKRHWARYFKKLHAGVRTPWDAKWLYALWLHDALVVVPNKNLVVNIGFSEYATHTKTGGPPTEISYDFPPPYEAPTTMIADEAADRFVFDTVFKVTYFQKVRYILSILYEKARSRR